MRVTAAITTYDRLHLAQRAIRSALRQDYKFLDIVIVEDGSSSGLKEWIEAEGIQFKVQYVMHDKRRGLAAARNTAIQLASGDWIAFLDDDDQWMSEKISRQVEAISQDGLESDGKIAVVGCGVQIVHPENNELIIQLPDDSGNIKSLIIKYGLNTFSSSYLFSRKALLDAGCFDESLTSSIDHDIWMAFAQKDYKVVSLKEPLVEMDFFQSKTKMMKDVRNRVRGVRDFLRKWMSVFDHWHGVEKAKEYQTRYFTNVIMDLARDKFKDKKYADSLYALYCVMRYGHDYKYKWTRLKKMIRSKVLKRDCGHRRNDSNISKIEPGKCKVKL